MPKDKVYDLIAQIYICAECRREYRINKPTHNDLICDSRNLPNIYNPGNNC